ncbi:MAG TPA: DNA polymerase III subunit delta', partial [Albitalea sp.]|nr:DNA polymerase III subunit delta' [Albitalea sp.]
DPKAACEWLAARGVVQPEVMLAAAGGQPQDTLQWVADGISAALWTGLPQQIARGEVGTLAGWPLPRVVEVLQKLCHDTMRAAAGAAPRYFPQASLTRPPPLPALTGWAKRLAELARSAEHPWNAGLMVESLVQEAREVLASGRPSGRRGERLSVHSNE